MPAARRRRSASLVTRSVTAAWPASSSHSSSTALGLGAVDDLRGQPDGERLLGADGARGEDDVLEPRRRRSAPPAARSSPSTGSCRRCARSAGRTARPGVQTRRSQAAESASPLPIANPSTSATVGLRTASSRPTMRSIVGLVLAARPRPDANDVNWVMSVPATNALPPAPRSTSTRTSSSASASSQRANSASYMAKVIALRASGRLNVIHAAGPRALPRRRSQRRDLRVGEARLAQHLAVCSPSSGAAPADRARRVARASPGCRAR